MSHGRLACVRSLGLAALLPIATSAPLAQTVQCLDCEVLLDPLGRALYHRMLSEEGWLACSDLTGSPCHSDWVAGSCFAMHNVCRVVTNDPEARSWLTRLLASLSATFAWCQAAAGARG